MSVEKLPNGTRIARELLPFAGIVLVALLTVLFVSALGTFLLV